MKEGVTLDFCLKYILTTPLTHKKFQVNIAALLQVLGVF
jgi:hypothetical protein